jgi:non-specific protein-tyrosine kinase
MGLEPPGTVVQITSPVSREGKTTTVANLAVSLAQAGKRVVIVDGDLRAPGIHAMFGAHNDGGVTSVLLGERSLAGALLPVPDQPSIGMLVSGAVPPNPSELLASKDFSELIKELKTHVDYLIIDTPPVLPVADALIVSAVADATLLVVAAGVSREEEVRRAMELLRQVEAPLRGTVFNRSAGGSGYGYGRYGEARSRRVLGRRRLAEVNR